MEISIILVWFDKNFLYFDLSIYNICFIINKLNIYYEVADDDKMLNVREIEKLIIRQIFPH